jgi:predicted dehydrogenase
MTSPLSVLIVGCGNIAGRFDAGRPGDWPRTHAGAYTRDGRFELAACVEPDDARRAEFMQSWKVAAGFRSMDDAARGEGRFDVISICSPTASHAHGLRAALGLQPKLIFCEKPASASAAETARLITACRDVHVDLAVNYTRRWDPAVADLKRGMEEKRWGALRSVVGYYNKGLMNNGSHMLDLLNLLLGPLRVIHVGKPVEDFADDPTLPAWLETAAGLPVQIACAHAADFAFFELQFIFARAVISMEEGGLYWRERAAADSAEFAGYRVPGEGARRPGGYNQAMQRSIDNIHGAIQRRDPLASTGESALAAQKLCEEIRQS